MKKHVMTKPVIIAAVLVLALLLGIGTAYAITVNTITPTTSNPWAGDADVTTPAGVSVDDYYFDFDSDLEFVTDLHVEVTGSGTLTLSWLIASGNAAAYTTLESGSISQDVDADPIYDIVLAGTTAIEDVEYIRVILN